MPRRAKALVADSKAADAARDNAQGQVTIKTETATHTARDGSTTLHTAAPAAASSITVHRKGAAQRSADRSIAGRSVKAWRIVATMPCRRVSSPMRVMTISTGAHRLMLPAATSAPWGLSTGRDSPLSSRSSTWVCPCTRRARNSSQRPANRKLANMVKESKYTSLPNAPPGSKVAPLLATKVTTTPRQTGTSMPMRPDLKLPQAERKNRLLDDAGAGRAVHADDPQR